MVRHKNLYSLGPKDLVTDGKQVELVAFGLFNTVNQVWKYYVCSIISDKSGYLMTTDLHSYRNSCTIDNISSYGRDFKNLEDAKKFINNFRDKWETGSNEPKQEVRDAKIKDILQEEIEN